MVFSGASELRPRCPMIMHSPSSRNLSLSVVTDDMGRMLHERRQPSGIADIREQGGEHSEEYMTLKGTPAEGRVLVGWLSCSSAFLWLVVAWGCWCVV